MIKKIFLGAVAALALMGCNQDDATVASSNLSKAADNFEVVRRIVFYNGITDSYMLTIEGKCSITVGDKKLDVTCKTGPKAHAKHFLGLSDNVTFFAEQLEDVNVSTYHHRIIFKPQSIIGDWDFKGSAEELMENQNNDG